MASLKIRIPYAVRHILSELEHLFRLELGVPMNVRIPSEGTTGTARFYFEGGNVFAVKTEVGRDPHFGQTVRIEGVRGRVCFYGDRKVAEEWLLGLTYFTGPITSSLEEDGAARWKLRFQVEGMAFNRLDMNSSNRQNGLPEWRYSDPKHPLRDWAARCGLEY